MLAYLLLGGRLEHTPTLERIRRLHPPQIVIAADGGVRHATTLEVIPQLWIGDFDSSVLPAHPPFPVEVWPRDKDRLDAELALERACAGGATQLILWGALGGRFDHTLALALMAVQHARAGLEVVLHSGDESAHPVLGEQSYRFDAEPGETLSLLALERLSGVQLGGVKWPLEKATLEPGSGWGMSNVALERQIRLYCSAGTGLLVQQHRPV